MKHRIKQWWDGEKVKDDGHYVPYLVTQPPWIRTLYERLPAWVWVTLGMGALKQVGEEAVKWFASWW